MPSRIAAQCVWRRGIHPSLTSSGNQYLRAGVSKWLGEKCTNSHFFSSVAIYDDYDDNHHNSALNCEYTSNKKTTGNGLDDKIPHCRTCTCSSNTIANTSTDNSTTATELKEYIQQLQTQNSEALQNDVQSQISIDHDSNEMQQQSSSPDMCHQSEPLVAPNTPLPPPLPKPNYSFKCRSLPPNLIAFNSTEGKSRFMHSLQTNRAEAYFPLSQQFLNQMDPAYCGISTLVLVLNALAIDPNVRWRGGWRWYGDESMLLERCCLEEERVRREGVTMEQYCGLARCQGVKLSMKRPINLGNDVDKCSDVDHVEEKCDLEEFRRDVINAVQHPPRSDWDDTTEEEANLQPTKAKGKSEEGFFLVTSFARHALKQTGDGHFSPIAAYHAPSDSCLVLDVARFKYAPYWVDVKELYEAMIPPDKATGKSRGWILMYPPPSKNDLRGKKRGDLKKQPLSKEELEGKRPAACVPLAGTGESICPVEKIKIDYCTVGK